MMFKYFIVKSVGSKPWHVKFQDGDATPYLIAAFKSEKSAHKFLIEKTNKV